MKTNRFHFVTLLVGVCLTFAILAPRAEALPRHRPGNPRGVMDPRGVFDPRGPFDPRNPHRYMYGMPSGYAVRAYRGVNFYYYSGAYYYPYYLNGQTVYTLAPVINGVPTVPSLPY